jgi:hypothetical protein
MLSSSKIYFVRLDRKEQEGGGLYFCAHMLVDCMTSGLSVMITTMQEAKWTQEELIETSAWYKKYWIVDEKKKVKLNYS